MGEAGRARAIELFSWEAIARETAALYDTLAGGAG
jgi:glycosyltransferase involved in cell wall biosynthesis